MSSALVLYHNPRCSKSRQTLALLRERGHEPQIIEYLQSPPDQSTLRGLLDKLAISPQALLRKGEKIAQELGLNAPGTDDETVIAAMLEHPILIERPILVAGDQARIGRPPEAVLEIL